MMVLVLKIWLVDGQLYLLPQSVLSNNLLLATSLNIWIFHLKRKL
jgi:hypothetical protein